MAGKHHKAIVSCWILVLIASLDTISHVNVEGKNVFNERDLKPKPKGTIKTIEVPEDGDLIDCVLFHKQPAFDHPLIKDLKVTKVDIPRITKDGERPVIYQNWHKYGECPKGTIPIRTTRDGDIHHKKHSSNSINYLQENVQASTIVGNYQGAFAIINIWKPNVEENDDSSAQMIVYSSDKEEHIEVGWRVDPYRYHDVQTRVYLHWSNGSTGSYDLESPGFVQTNRRIALGSPITPWSEYNKTITESHFFLYKRNDTGHWYFLFQEEVIGYLPSSITPKLHDKAGIVTWGGVVGNTRYKKKHHTTAQMGSGHLPSEGNNKAAYFRNMQIMKSDYTFEHASNLQLDFWDKNCYDIVVGEQGTNYFSHAFFGGPGYSAQCP